MNQPRNLSRSGLGSLVLIAAILGGSAAAFAYTAGWFSPQRLTPEKMVEALTPPGGVPPGHRRNHAKGICFTGVFEANGNGVQLSQREVFAQGQLSGARPLQSRHAQSERGRCDGAGARHGTADLDGRTARNGGPP